MMERYYKAPQIQGRPLNYKIQTRGKKHYWGIRGKNYGFYTTPQQAEMETRRKQNHRRIRSQAYDYYNDNNQRYRVEPALERKTVGVEDEENEGWRRKEDERKFVTTGVQAENKEKDKRQIAVQTDDNEPTLRQQMQEVLTRQGKEQRLGALYRKHNSLLPEIKHRSQSMKDPPSQRSKHFSMSLIEKPAQKINPSLSKRPQEQHIVYFYRKNRQNNPTYCNSFDYPLPCYRHVC